MGVPTIIKSSTISDNTQKFGWLMRGLGALGFHLIGEAVFR